MKNPFSKSENRIELGEKVRDMITGFEGTATGRHEYQYGCIRYTVEPVVGADGKLGESCYVDEQRLEPIGREVKAAKAVAGGPQDAPKRTPVPKR